MPIKPSIKRGRQRERERKKERKREITLEGENYKVAIKVDLR